MMNLFKKVLKLLTCFFKFGDVENVDEQSLHL